MKLEPVDCVEDAEITAIRLKSNKKAVKMAFKVERRKVFWRELAGALLAASILFGLFDYAFNFFP
jgi:hypothetical protein